MGTRAPFKFLKDEDLAYAVNLVETVTWLAGKPDYLDDLAETVQTLDLFGPSPGRARSAKVFEWLAATMSLQGISDQVAQSYMSDYGRPRWASIGPRGQNRQLPFAQTFPKTERKKKDCLATVYPKIIWLPSTTIYFDFVVVSSLSLFDPVVLRLGA